jgi:hypothetical protein
MANRNSYFNSDESGVTLKFHQKNQEPKNTFDRATPCDVEKVILQKKSENKEEASEILEKLEPVQILGIINFRLNLNQVTVPKLEAHTLAGISGLTKKKKGLTNEEAFERLKGLDEIKTLAIVELGFTRDQVLYPNFGEHTVLGTVALIKSKKAKTSQKALGMIQGLNHFQTHGVVFDNLTQNQVKDPDFGVHTVLDMNALQKLGLTSTEAFNKLKGLNAPETTKVATEVFSSLINKVSTHLNDKKHSTSKIIASLLGLAQPQLPDDARGESLRKNGKETTKNLPEKKSRKPRRQ